MVIYTPGTIINNWHRGILRDYHSTIIAPTIIPTTINAMLPQARPSHTTELALLANVVMKVLDGLGEPLIVTVGTVGSGVTDADVLTPVALTIENISDRQCLTICVEFMNTIK